jgi:beta-lactamase superfamily II metal-dependent hydrolase
MRLLQTKANGWLTGILICAGVAVLAQTRKTLDMYVIDVEGGGRHGGGAAVLLVAPSGQSLLADTGTGVADVDLVMKAVHDAGITQIDYLVSTHYHSDHVGGLATLPSRIPIRNFVDHGDVIVESNANMAAMSAKSYQIVAEARKAGHHLPVRPGDRIPVAGLDVQVVSAAGVIKTPLPGAGATNPLCPGFKPLDETCCSGIVAGENGASVGILIRYGRFSTLDFGDLTMNREAELACPRNLLGTVDLYLTTQHGVSLSNARVLVHALRPRVAIMNNGAHKGASSDTMETLRSSPGLRDIWQLHFAEERPPSALMAEVGPQGGRQNSTQEDLIANLDNSTTFYLKVSARADGGFTVVNPRNAFSRDYPALR